MQKDEINTGRRQFLKLSLAAGTCLVMRIALPGGESGASTGQGLKSGAPGHAFSNAWIKLHADNTITVIVNHSEMGQGITTALSMIVAEELEADWSLVHFEIAPVADVYKHPHYGIQWTVSSRSVESSWQILREAGATMRELLIAAAASKWDVAAGACRAVNSSIEHTATGRTLPYGDLIDTAATMALPTRVRLKDPKTFTIIGRRVPRLDGPDKVDGSARFGMDIRLPGMLTATVIHPPVFGAAIKSYNHRTIASLPGVRNLLPIATGLAIVADTFWQARVALDRLEVTWKAHKREHVNSAQLLEHRKILGQKKGNVEYSAGDIHAVMDSATRIFEAAYDLPYQAHATPEPMNCTADVKEDKCDVWAPTQNQKSAEAIAVKITGLPRSAIHIHTTYLGGGFGRRALVDYVGEAVELSMKMKAPVKVIWTREEDIRRDYYRPSTHNIMQAVIDQNGQPKAWLHRIVGADAFGQALPKVITALMPDFLPQFLKNTAAAAAEWAMPRFVSGKKAVLGAGPLPYAFEHMQVEFINDDPGIPLCWWRSVAPSSNCFAVECFLDEIAVEARQDPYALRYKLLANTPRLRHVLKLAAEKAGWGKQPSGNVHRGIACHNFQNTMIAMVAEVAVLPNGYVTVHRVVCALDCGTAVNPKIIEAQIQSGIVFGLTATLKSEITISNGVADQSNFDDFPILRYHEMPVVEVHIVPSDLPPTGIGETAVPVISPAVANAVFASTGKRIRKLPIKPADLV